MTTTPIRTNLIPTYLGVLRLIFGHWIVRLGVFRESGVATTHSIAAFTFVIAAGVAFQATPSKAQEYEGAITLRGEFLSCRIIDDGPGLRTVYVYHDFTAAATASRFRVEPGPDCTMTYVSETHSFPMTLGNAQDGLSVCYGSCMQGSFLIATLTYMSYGTSAPCGQLHVVPHPLAATLEVMRCDGNAVTADPRDVYVGTSSCGCPTRLLFPGDPQLFNCEPVGVQASTWGAIKALYRDGE